MSIYQEGFFWSILLTAAVLLIYGYASLLVWLEEFDNLLSKIIIAILIIAPIYAMGTLLAISRTR